MSYIRQTWVDNSSIVDAEKLNHIEDGIYDVDNKVEILSSSETKTNRIWENGKPIYSKVITIPNFSNTTVTVNTGIANSDEVVSFYGHFKRPSIANKTYGIENLFMEEWTFNQTNGELTMATNNQYVTFYGKMVIEYTKTTDTPVSL